MTSWSSNDALHNSDFQSEASDAALEVRSAELHANVQAE
jgi:hypothetical protein